MADILERFTPANRALLGTRATLQRRIHAWYQRRRGQPHDALASEAEIGYLLSEPAPFTISPGRIDPEIADIAGPQLVVPILNGRFLLNAAIARWGSMYDVFYGPDALAPPVAKPCYDPTRGAEVIAWAKALLDDAVPLAQGRDESRAVADQL